MTSLRLPFVACICGSLLMGCTAAPVRDSAPAPTRSSVQSGAEPPPPPSAKVQAPTRHAQKRSPARVAPTPAAGTAGSADAAEEEWFAGLKQSRLDWDVPSTMVLDQMRLMTVRIYGYGDAQNAGDALPNATGGASVRVATQMSAELVPVNSEDLKLVALDAQSQKYVPATGFTDWSWNVTPLHSGKEEKIRLTVYVILDASHRRSFVTYSKPFTIAVADRGSVKDYVEDHFSGMAKYLLPGGAGFVALAGLVQWWRKRSQTKEGSPPRVGD